MISQILKNIPFIYKEGLIIKHFFLARASRKAIERYIANTKIRKLQIGAGQNNLKGWFNTDYFPRQNIFFLNTAKPLNIITGSFDYIFSEHHIEHIQYNEAKLMISELYRILKKGGVLRICTPDLKAYLETYFSEKNENDLFVKDILSNWINKGFAYAKYYSPADENNISFFINDIFHNYEHKFIYDYSSLEFLLRQVGFTKIYRSDAGTSMYPTLNNIESHSKVFELPYTLAIEAVK